MVHPKRRDQYWAHLVEPRIKGGVLEGFLEKCTPLSAVALWVPNVLLGHILGSFLFPVTLDSAETPFAKTPLLLVPGLTCSKSEPTGMRAARSRKTTKEPRNQIGQVYCWNRVKQLFSEPPERGRKNGAARKWSKSVENFLTLFDDFWHFLPCAKIVETIFDEFWRFLTWPLSAGPFCNPLTFINMHGRILPNDQRLYF